MESRAVGDLAWTEHVAVAPITRVLGRPIATPPVDLDTGQRRTYRIWRWDCPVCHQGERDPIGLFRPFWLDSNGRLGCVWCYATVAQISEALALLGVSGVA
jgi:hypothetical protein